jgi:hypothetical protein
MYWWRNQINQIGSDNKIFWRNFQLKSISQNRWSMIKKLLKQKIKERHHQTEEPQIEKGQPLPEMILGDKENH